MEENLNDIAFILILLGAFCISRIIMRNMKSDGGVYYFKNLDIIDKRLLVSGVALLLIGFGIPVYHIFF